MKKEKKGKLFGGITIEEANKQFISAMKGWDDKVLAAFFRMMIQSAENKVLKLLEI